MNANNYQKEIENKFNFIDYFELIFTGIKVVFFKAAKPPIVKPNIVSLDTFLNIIHSLYSFSSKSSPFSRSKTAYILSDSTCTKPLIKQLIINFIADVMLLNANASEYTLIALKFAKTAIP